MSVPKYGKRWPVYAQQWDEMQRTRTTDEREAAAKIFAHKARYQAVEAKTGVPWYWIGPVHYRESDLDFNTQLAQGDPLGHVSTHVPKGQGPYFGNDAWERAALIALEDTGATEVIDWRLEKMIYHWEQYNGWGYYKHDIPSPYVWAGSSIQQPGKYVSDGVWDAGAVDQQLGCAPILESLMELDPSIKPARETPMGEESAPQPPSEPPVLPEPSMPQPQLPPPRPPEIVITQEQFDALLAAARAGAQAAKPIVGPLLQKLASAGVLSQFGIYGVAATLVLQIFGFMGPTTSSQPAQAALGGFATIALSGITRLVQRIADRGKE